MFLTVRKCLKPGVAHVSPRCFKSMLFYRVFLCAQITVIFRSKRVLEVFFDVWLRRRDQGQSPVGPFACIFTCFCAHGKHFVCIFTCAGASGPASSMHFYLLRRPWGSIFYAFLPVPALLGQHLLCIFTCSGAPGPASSMHFHRCRRLWAASCMHLYMVFA